MSDKGGGGGGMPTPGAIRESIGQLEKQKNQLQMAELHIDGQIVEYEAKKAELIKNKQEMLQARSQIQDALTQLPPDHPQRAEMEKKLQTVNQNLANIEKGIQQYDMAIMKLRAQKAQYRMQRETQLKPALAQRKALLVQLTARENQKKKQAVHAESGKVRG